ncbi:septum site-determining protein Ssd [Nocardioides coralli]|uniref:septum site-determining protein Ssd n=1 Tax=Nocardioides coralli TaxID=2872154 RepID=UPI001CA436C2|nr:septum site-determining protein Ssd [Nocardioides coralli]QZY29376.1 septum site determining protein [Nocardioides coralli]
MTAPLIVTCDQTLLDELLRLGAAAGVSPSVAADAATGLAGWAAAPLVLVGADLAEELAELRPLRRDGVHVVSWGTFPAPAMRTALTLGAENVAELPQSGEWVVEQLTDLGDQRPRRARTLGVVGGSGGAGATVFAAALGQVAAAAGPAVVVDADPLGPGMDRVLGMEDRSGVRWDELCQTTGRLGATALRESLPRRDGLGVLTWYAGAPGTLQPFAVREVLSAAQRGHETVVVDLPRRHDGLLDEAIARCDEVLVVTRASVGGLASAARVVAGLPDAGAARLVLRGPGLDAADVARVVDTPVVAAMGDQRGLAESIDLGLGPVRTRRSPLARTAREVLGSVATRSAA